MNDADLKEKVLKLQVQEQALLRKIAVAEHPEIEEVITGIDERLGEYRKTQNKIGKGPTKAEEKRAESLKRRIEKQQEKAKAETDKLDALKAELAGIEPETRVEEQEAIVQAKLAELAEYVLANIEALTEAGQNLGEICPEVCALIDEQAAAVE